MRRNASTQNNVDETEEKKDFHVEKLDTSKETMDSTVKEIVKKKYIYPDG